MTSSTASLVNSANSHPVSSFTSSSSTISNTFFREERSSFTPSHGFAVAHAAGPAPYKLKSTAPPPPLIPLSSPFSPSSFLSMPGGLSPSELLNSPMFLPSSNILASPTTGSFPTQTVDWRGNWSNYQQELKNSSLQIFTRPSSMQTSSSFHPSSTGLMSSEEEAFKGHQQPWSYQQSAQLNSTEIPTLQASTQQEYNKYQQMRDHRRTDDGYKWRKYGQKQVKGSENPRSYYKCTHSSCPTKKKVEMSLDGQITEIIYKGTHNHPKPQQASRNSASFQAIQGSFHPEKQEHSSSGKFGTPTTPENSSASFGNEDLDMMNSQSIGSRGEDFDDDDDEPEAKKWKMEGENEGISASGIKTVRKPKVVVQTLSDIDILEDGYRWRKYGQKVVKGNPNPRSYYKCTATFCPVRKHIERAPTNLREVITTYEGRHNHHVPAPRRSGGGMPNRPLFDDTNNSSNNNNNDSYNMSSNPTATRPLASDPFFGKRPNGLDSIGFSRYQLQQQNPLPQQQKQGESVFSMAKEEPRDDLFIDSWLS